MIKKFSSKALQCYRDLNDNTNTENTRKSDVLIKKHKHISCDCSQKYTENKQKKNNCSGKLSFVRSMAGGAIQTINAHIKTA